MPSNNGTYNFYADIRVIVDDVACTYNNLLYILRTGRPGYFDSGYTEAGAPPTLLEDGNYFATYDTIIDPGVATGKKHGWAAGWMVLNGSNPRQVLQRGNEPLLVPTMPWERQTPPEWDWMQATTEGGLPMIGATNGLMPLGNDSFVAWACASDSVVEAFVVRVSRW